MGCVTVYHISSGRENFFVGDCVVLKIVGGGETSGLITRITGKGMNIYNGSKDDPFVHCTNVSDIYTDHEAWVI